MKREDPDRLVRDVGRRIAQLRREVPLTQEEFAEKLGASVQWASRVENGENLTLHSLAKVANVLGVPVRQFFEPLDQSPSKAPRGRGRPRRRQG